MPTYTMTGPTGQRFSLDAGPNVSRKEAEAELRRRIDAYTKQSRAAAPTPAREPAPVEPAQREEDENFLLTAVKRGLPTIKQGAAQIIEDYPRIVAGLASTFQPGSMGSSLFGALGRTAAESETYKGLTGETVKGMRESAQRRLAELGPREYGGFFEEEGFGRRLGSLAETVAESALPVGAGLATGLLTRSPVAAGAVMGAGSVPMTYGGIRERQQAEGIDDVQRAVIGTAVSSALDVLTGVGGKVLSGTAAAAARELLEGGLKQAIVRTAKSGGEEAGTEALQNVVEQVAGGTNPATKQAMLETLESGLAGALGGTVFTGASEVVTAPFRSRAREQTINEIVTSPEGVAEFQRLAGEAVAQVMEANPGMSRNDAVNIVMEQAEKLRVQAVANILGTEGDLDVDTRLDVTGGGRAGVPSDLEPGGAAVGAPEFGEVDTGRVGEPLPSVPVSDVGAGTREPTLAPITGEQITATIPVIEQSFAENEIDFVDIYGVQKLTKPQKVQAARIVLQSPEVDPYDAITSVIERGIRLRGEKPPAAAPVAEPEPVVEQPSVAPVEAPAAPEVAAQPLPEPQFAPEVQPTPTVAETITEEKMATPATKTLNDLAGIGTVNPENTNEVLVQGGGVQLTPVADNVVQVDSLRAVETGGGRKAMEQLVQVADSNGTELQLSPEPFAAPAGKEMSPTELTEWYKGFGFQEQPDGSMVRPAAAPPATSIMPSRQEYTPQEIADNLRRFGVREAQDRGYDPNDADGTRAYAMFNEGVRDSNRDIEPIADAVILEKMGPEALQAYKEGMQWGKDRIADAAKAAATEAAPKAKAVGTTGTKAKQVKATIKRKPGKTAAEKVFNMAQAELDAMPKEDMVEQTTPYDPEYETIRAKPGINATRMAKMLGPQLYGDPTNMGQVCIKEVLQNSFDATRTAINEGQIERGAIDIVVSDDGRKLTVKDNGIGMTPELLGGKFLEIAGTAKEGDKNAGGFGIAKMLFLYANKNIRVTTARDGRIAELDVTGEQLFEALDNPEAAPNIEIRDFAGPDFMVFPDGHGTVIQLTIPEEAGEYKIKELPRWLDNIPALELSPLFADIDVSFHGRSYARPELVSTGANFPIEDYTQFVGVKFPWGVAKVYVTRAQTGQEYGDNMHILSNGLWQFSTQVKKDPSEMWGKSVPYRFYVDIVPSVKPDEPGYPFNFNRQNFTDDAKADFGKIKNYIDALYAYKSRAGEATSFGNIQYFDANGQLGPIIDITPDIPVQDTAFTRIAEGDEITVGADGSLLVNGQPMPELTPEQLKSGIPSDNELRVNPDLIDTNAVMVHDNTDVVIKRTGERMPIPEFMRRQFGERFDQFMKFNGDTFLTLRNEVARVMGYSGLYDEAIGVSFDPEYRGVSIRLPFSGSFINPLVPKYGDGLRAGYGIFGTMVHELAHHKVRSHNANFPAEMQDILLNMEADEGFAYQQFKDNFADTIAADYADIVQLGVELFNGKNPDISVEYRGNRFTEGSGEQAPEGAGVGGTGDVRGPSGEGGPGESLLGPAYERRRGAGERGQPEGGEGGGPPITDEAVDKAVSVKLTKAQMKRLEAAAGIRRKDLNNMQKRIVQSRNTNETLGLIGRLTKLAHNTNDAGILASIARSMPPAAYRVLLGFQQIETVFAVARNAGIKSLAKVDDLMRNGYIPYVNRMIMSAREIDEMWGDFASKNEAGNMALDDAIMISNMLNVDPSQAPTAAAYMQIDEDLRGLQQELAKSKDANEQKSLKARISIRKNDIQRVYFGGEEQTETGETVQVAGWNDVPPEGRKIYKAARDFYRNNFNEHYRLLMQRIDDADLDKGDADRVKASVRKMFDKARERVIYFPVKRFGEYWVSVGNDFYMRESLAEQEALIARLESEGETRQITPGEGRQNLRNLIANKDASGALKDILDLLDDGNTVDAKGQAKIKDMDELRDLVFQMYLTSLPEADLRRRFIHREFKTGFSTDALRTFATTAVASANQLGRLAYNYRFQAAIEEAKKETEGNRMKPWLDTITNEVDLKVQGVMSPREEDLGDAIVAFAAKLNFFNLLSAPSSAFMNLTQLHVVGLPVLSAEFGEAKTAEMAARYTGSFLTGQQIPNPIRDADGNIALQAPDFRFENSGYMRKLKESDPERYEQTLAAWRYANEHDVIESTFSAGSELYARTNVPTGDFTFTQALRRGEALTAAQRATANTINGMGYAFHKSEVIGRSIMYMSSFDLAYERAIKQGKSPEAAGKEARSLAAKLTNRGMFDFSNWNKSRFAQTRPGRIILQMQSYRQSMYTLLFRSFVRMLPLMNKEGKLAAARVFFGVAGMTALYGGLRATHISGLVMGAYTVMKFVESLFDEDDEEKELEQGYLNEETFDRELFKFADKHGNELALKDAEYYIRAHWIPETFGKGSTLQNALGLSDENAAKLAAVADMGLPALGGVDLSNSVALNELWSPVEAKGNTPEVRALETLARYGLGPTAASVAQYVKAAQAWEEGDIEKGFEAALPAIIRNYIKSERLASEGLRVGKNEDIVLKDPTYYTSGKSALISFGFRDAETSRNMQLDIAAGKIEDEIAAEKTKLLDRRYRAIIDFEADPSKENEREYNRAERNIDIYNLNYPSNAITGETKRKSLRAKLKEAEGKAYGLEFDPNIPIRMPLAEERAAQLADEEQ